jgi:hypothetical protein
MNRDKITLFLDQARECRKEGMIGVGTFQSFKDHPELLPLFPNKKMVEAIKSGVWTGVEQSSCLRFGGDCHSKNEECMKMRGVPFEETKT